jgi:arabinogalactan oligomer/maltooligosaccharide transport system permease protein
MNKYASMKRKRFIGNLLSYILLILISLIWLFPFFGLLMGSFRSYDPAVEYGGIVSYVIPKTFSLDNYRFVLGGTTNYLRWYGNTLIIAFFVAIFQTIIVLCVSYALSRMRFRGRTALMRFWLVLGMFPGFLTMICLYFLLKQMGLTQAGAVPGLILVSVASSGMGYYVCKGYFDTIPKALDEAARIDGASRARVFLTMTIPMSKPIIIYAALCAFMGPWCDYVFASYIAFGHDESYNVAVSMYRWMNTGDYQGYFTRFCAGGILVAIPITLLFMALQRYYVEGVTGGAVKG